MQFFNEILEGAVLQYLYEQKGEIIKNMQLNISYSDIEKIISTKEFLLLKNITDILAEDTDDFTAIEKIVDIFKENHIDYGGRHDRRTTIYSADKKS